MERWWNVHLCDVWNLLGLEPSEAGESWMEEENRDERMNIVESSNNCFISALRQFPAFLQFPGYDLQLDSFPLIFHLH